MADYTIAGVCYNKNEADLAKKLSEAIKEWGTERQVEETWYIADDDNPYRDLLKRVQGPVRQWTVERFEDTDAIIYICSAVRVVRYIGKLIKEQMTDPAVLVVDPAGRYCIPLLSGRRGEAYELAGVFEERIGMTFIDKTMPDDDMQFDIERYVHDNKMIMSNSDYAKEIQAALSAGDTVGFYTNYPVIGTLPDGMEWASKGNLGIYLSPSYHSAYFDHTLWLIPQCLVVGIECEKGQNYRQIDKLVSDVLKDYSLYPEAIGKIATLDTLETDPAIQALCYEKEVPVVGYSKQQLDEIRNSDGSDMEACESAALKASEGKLMIGVVERDGIRCAVAIKNIYVKF